MKRFAALLAATAIVACQGPTGPEGPVGAAGNPYNRNASYCAGVNTTADTGNGWTLTARCSNVADIPIEGWCFAQVTLPAGAHLTVNEPVNWSDTTQVAGWRCTWGWDNGSTPSPIPAIVEICCATPQ